ncbi:MAG: ABC transporter ATP-binding protein [Nocardioidaceae bacterium]|nr:ABC transporter ATP-binding protein [Nocardioidaceae bacterium]
MTAITTGTGRTDAELAGFVRGEGLRLSFGATPALRGASLVLPRGEITALMGPSGSGKSTLMHCLAGILRPDAGQAWLGDQQLSALSERQRSDARLNRMGFVFQNGDLVPELTLLENVTLPLQLTGSKSRTARERARELLGELGIVDEADRRAGAVSGGQAQRAAIARALVHRPDVLFADEPTGALDTSTGEQALDAITRLARQAQITVLLVTHDNRVAAHADRLLTMRDGRVVGPDQDPK